MGSNVWKIVQWAQEKGPVKAVERIRMMVLSDAIQEKVSLKNIDINTRCSPKLEKAIREAAEAVVGARCPV